MARVEGLVHFACSTETGLPSGLQDFGSTFPYQIPEHIFVDACGR